MTRLGTWYVTNTDSFQVTANVVRAPLTLGHTQLAITKPSAELGEVERWDLAFPHLKAVVGAMERVLRGAQHQIPELEFVRQYTRTSGAFLKIIVLRTSASEQPGEFKLHLVPYFQSHADSAWHRFRGIHGGRVKQDGGPLGPGGLIGWLGDRETQIDGAVEVRELVEHNSAKSLTDKFGQGTLADLFQAALGQKTIEF